jgi:hypothetical protein
MGTNEAGNLVNDWHVSDKSSMSDRRYIFFQICNIEPTAVTFRDPKKINWESYKDGVWINLEVIPQNICLMQDVELAVDQLQQALLSSCHQNFPARTAHLPRNVSWWNKELSCLRTKRSRLFERAKRTGEWDSYKVVLACISKEIRKAKKSS